MHVSKIFRRAPLFTFSFFFYYSLRSDQTTVVPVSERPKNKTVKEKKRLLLA